MTPIQKTARVGTQEILLETGKIAKQAHGAVWVPWATPSCSSRRSPQRRRRKASTSSPSTTRRSSSPRAVPGSFFRREGRPTEGDADLAHRRPLLPAALRRGQPERDAAHRDGHLLRSGERHRRARAHRRVRGAAHLRHPVQRPDRRRPRRPRNGEFVANPTLAAARGGGPRRHHGRLARRDRDGGGRREGGVRAGDGGRAPSGTRR